MQQKKWKSTKLLFHFKTLWKHQIFKQSSSLEIPSELKIMWWFDLNFHFIFEIMVEERFYVCSSPHSTCHLKLWLKFDENQQEQIENVSIFKKHYLQYLPWEAECMGTRWGLRNRAIKCVLLRRRILFSISFTCTALAQHEEDCLSSAKVQKLLLLNIKTGRIFFSLQFKFGQILKETWSAFLELIVEASLEVKWKTLTI